MLSIEDGSASTYSRLGEERTRWLLMVAVRAWWLSQQNQSDKHSHRLPIPRVRRVVSCVAVVGHPDQKIEPDSVMIYWPTFFRVIPLRGAHTHSVVGGVVHDADDFGRSRGVMTCRALNLPAPCPPDRNTVKWPAPAR